MPTKRMLQRQQKRAVQRLGKQAYFSTIDFERRNMSHVFNENKTVSQVKDSARDSFKRLKNEHGVLPHRLKFVPSFRGGFQREAQEQMLRRLGIPLSEKQLESHDEASIKAYVADRSRAGNIVEDANKLRQDIHRARVSEKRESLHDPEMEKLREARQKNKSKAQENYYQLRRWSKYSEYTKTASFLREKIPYALCLSQMQRIAKSKLRELFNPKSTINFRGEEYAHTLVRFESLARVMTQFSKPIMFAGAEAGVIENKFLKK
ncbi:MAG: hypothetical protein NTY48_00715 [Candidatus Diapherotrites archaeon]|nr:hypothetical protein [Candidatus Diapherotrites archaeon]